MDPASAVRQLPSGAMRQAGGERAPAQRAALQLVLAIITIASTAVLFRLSELPPSATAFYRTILALPILVLWLGLERRRQARATAGEIFAWRRDGLVLAVGGLVFAVNIACYAWAIHFTAIANASLLSNVSPIFVTLGSYLLFGERVGRRFLAALGAAIVGAVILTADKLSLAGNHLLGDVLGVLSAAFFAAYLVIVGRLRQRLSSGVIMLWTGVFTALALGAMSFGAGERLVPATAWGWAVLFALAFVTYALGQGLLTSALAGVSATFSSLALLSLPVNAALLGWLLLGEPLTLNQVVGGAIVLASIFMARRARG